MARLPPDPTFYPTPSMASEAPPERLTYVALLASGDNGPGGIFVIDHETFEVKGPWEKERGPQHLAYDFWWHLGHASGQCVR